MTRRGMILAVPSVLKFQESEVGRLLEERYSWREFWREKNLIWWYEGCLFCIRRVVCRRWKGGWAPWQKEYICLTYLKSYSWSAGRGQFKSGTEVLSFLEIVGSFLSFYRVLTIICKILSPQRAWRPFQKHEVIKFGWSDDYEWSKPGNDRLENGRIWL